MTINYYSTNKQSPKVDFFTAIRTGQAPDRGLYMPETIPTIAPEVLFQLKGLEYYEVAYTILKHYLTEMPEEDLFLKCKDAYKFFPHIEKVTDKDQLMRLDRGPTASFKDYAAQMMSRLMGYGVKDESKLTILTATSGDTGSAVAHAFHNIPNIDVIILFPFEEVSDNQRKQMTTLGGNVRTIAIDGKFDHGQAMVKQAFSDERLKQYNLTSANSINIARLLPQSVYYFWAYIQLIEKAGDEIIFSVPSGNFGDMMGAVLAQKMGLPIRRLIISTNENDEFPTFLSTGKYAKIDPSRCCISNAMNVGHPSNLARLIDIFGGKMNEKGELLESPDLAAMQKLLYSSSVTDEQTRATIGSTYKEHNCILEPHGSVGWHGLQQFRKDHPEEKDVMAVCLETADPAKFPEEIEKLIGVTPEVPKSLSKIHELEEHYDRIAANYDAFFEYLNK